MSNKFSPGCKCCPSGHMCSPCCSSSPDSCILNWGGGLSAVADCDGCDNASADNYSLPYIGTTGTFGDGCFWGDSFGPSGLLYGDCVVGRTFGIDSTSTIGKPVGFGVQLVHDSITDKCYLTCAVCISVALDTTIIIANLVAALYVSVQSNVANHFCSGTFTLNLVSTDPSYNQSGGNSIWTWSPGCDPFVSDWTPYTGGCTGTLPATVDVTF